MGLKLNTTFEIAELTHTGESINIRSMSELFSDFICNLVLFKMLHLGDKPLLFSHDDNCNLFGYEINVGINSHISVQYMSKFCFKS